MTSSPVSQELIHSPQSGARRMRARPVPSRIAFAACRKLAQVALLTALSGLSVASHAASPAGTLADYSALEQALDEGQTVNVRIDFTHCTSKDGNHPGPNLHGGVRIDSYIVLPDRNIAFSDVHHTLDPQNHPTTEYVRYRVAPDQTATVSIAFLAGSSDTATPRGEYRCPINQGIRFIAASR
jgi:VirK protein